MNKIAIIGFGFRVTWKIMQISEAESYSSSHTLPHQIMFNKNRTGCTLALGRNYPSGQIESEIRV